MEQAFEPGNTGQMSGASGAPALPGTVISPPTASLPPAAPIEASSAAPLAVPAAVSASVPAPEPVAAPTVREDQVQNAVGFLSHPQVRGSTNTASKRAFLERKGLNAAEIDEAFRRVPEAPPQPAAAPVAPPPPPAAAPQPAAFAPQPAPQGQQLVAHQQPYTTAATFPGTQLVAMQPAAPPGLAPQVAPSYRWSQVVLGVGAVVAAGWAVQQLVLPRLRSLVDSWQAHRREAEEARNKELHSAVSSLQSCQEELKVSTQALLEAVNLMREQQRASTMDGVMQTRGAVTGRPMGAPSRDSYYQGMSGRNDAPPQYGGPGGGNPSRMLPGSDNNYASIRAAAGSSNEYEYVPIPPVYEYADCYSRGGAERGPVAAGPTGGDGGGRGGAAGMYGASNPLYGAVRSAASNPYGGPGVGAGQQQQQQESLSYRVTAPPSPANSAHSLQQSGRPQQQQQPPMGGLSGASGPYGSSDRLYDPSVPGAGGAGQGSKASGGANAAAAATTASGPDGRTVPRPPPEQPVYPQSFHEVMEMVQQGITPPNVRTDINDSPPDPNQPLSEARMATPLKPWERSAAAGGNGAGLPAGSSGPSYGDTASTSRANGAPYGWDMPPSGQSFASASPPMLPTSYGMPPSSSSAAAAGGAAGPSGTAGGGTSAGSAGRVSNSGGGGGGGSGGLSFLPPANPAWRPPPPPVRTVVASSPASPPPAPGTGGMGAGGEAAPGAAAAAPALAAEIPEPAAALAGPPSPSPSQPAFAASATELTRTPDGPSAFDTLMGLGPGSFAASGPPAVPPPPPPPHSQPPPPPPPPPAAGAVMGSAEAACGAAADPASPSASAAPGISTP